MSATQNEEQFGLLFFKKSPRGQLFIDITLTFKVTSYDETDLLVLILEIFQIQTHKSKYGPGPGLSLGAYKKTKQNNEMSRNVFPAYSNYHSSYCRVVLFIGKICLN